MITNLIFQKNFKVFFNTLRSIGKKTASIVMITQLIQGAFDLYPSSTFNMAGGHLRLSNSERLVDSFSDPANLANLKRIGANLNWGRKFQLKDLEYNTWAIGFPMKTFGIGLGGSLFGNQIYNETILAVMVGKSIGKKLEIGINISAYRLTIQNYGQTTSAGVTISWHYHFTSDWIWATSIRNINSPVVSQEKERLPQVVTMGILGKYSKQFFTQIEWEHDIAYEGRLKFGVVYFPTKWMGISTGYASSPSQATFGLILNLNWININYALGTHSQLNRFTQQVGLGTHLGRN